jgi:hypothetical protein
MGAHSNRQFNVFGADEATLRVWNMFFGALYGIQPEFANDTVARLVSDGFHLIVIAEGLGAVDRIRGIVELALLREAEVVWDSVASNPAIWADLGYRLHSTTILSEAVIHLVGNWRRIDEEVKQSMNPEVKSLVQNKYIDLEKAKMVIDLRIMGHYPLFMWRRAQDKPGRASYGNDIYAWMTVSHFRSWYAQAIAENQTRNAKDGGFDFYSRIATGGEAYLDKPSFQAFHDMFPMSSKACNVLQDNMNVLKIDASKFVDGLLVNRAHAHNADYLTCCKVEKSDMPWHFSDSDDETDDDNRFAHDAAATTTQFSPKTQSSRLGKRKARGFDDDDESDDEDLNLSDEEAPPGPSTPQPHSATTSSDLERPINDYDAIPDNSNNITAAPPRHSLEDTGFTSAITPGSPVREGWGPDAIFGPPLNLVTPSRIDPTLLCMGAQNGQTQDDAETSDARTKEPSL